MRYTLHPAGRVLVVRSSSPVDGEGPAPEAIAKYAADNDARYVLVDTSYAPYTDSDGIRWMMRLKSLPLPCRIVIRPRSRIGRTLKLVNFDRDVFDSARLAWHTPWRRSRAGLEIGQAEAARSAEPAARSRKGDTHAHRGAAYSSSRDTLRDRR